MPSMDPATFIRKQVGRLREEAPLDRAWRLRNEMIALNPRAAEAGDGDIVRKTVGRPRSPELPPLRFETEASKGSKGPTTS